LYYAIQYDFKTFIIRPIVDSSNASKTIVFPYIKIVDVMANDDDDPWESIPAFYDHHQLVGDLACYYEKTGAGEFNQAESSFKNNFGAGLNELIMKSKSLYSGHTDMYFQDISIGDYDDNSGRYGRGFCR
jgi:hypothetical protein